MIDAKKLWKERTVAFWRDILPYLRFVASSGLAIFLFVLFIVSVHFYAELLENLPEQFPVNWIALVCFLPVLAFNPIRTFFRPADIIFLLPAEDKLKPYLQRAMLISCIVQSMFVIVVWLALWPVYRVIEAVSFDVFLLILLLLLIIKWVSLFARWQELQCQERTHMMRYTIVRWIFTAALLYLLFTFSPGKVALVIALVLLTYIAALRIPEKHMIHWELLIAMEEQQQAKYYAFLSWFVDTPHFQSKVQPRRFISHLTNLLAFKQTNTYRYLYLKTFLRTEVFSMVLRLVLLGMLIIFFLQHDILKGTLFIFFSYLIGVQLSALEQHHRYSFWLYIYPISAINRVDAVAAIVLRVHLVVVVLLYMAVIISMGAKLYALYTVLLGIGFLLLYHLRLRGNLKRKSEEL